MIKWFLRTSVLIIIFASVSVFSFSLPQLFWPQKDIAESEVNSPKLTRKVLIASRAGAYKTALVEKIKKAFKNDSVYVKCIGLSRVLNESADDYNAIVLINTCMAWDWDRNVFKFLKSRKDARKVIVLTTSGSGDWVPNKKKWAVDAVASASVKSNTDGVSGEIVLKINQILDSNRGGGTP
jgi:hypothetical protein